MELSHNEKLKMNNEKLMKKFPEEFWKEINFSNSVRITSIIFHF